MLTEPLIPDLTREQERTVGSILLPAGADMLVGYTAGRDLQSRPKSIRIYNPQQQNPANESGVLFLFLSLQHENLC